MALSRLACMGLSPIKCMVDVRDSVHPTFVAGGGGGDKIKTTGEQASERRRYAAAGEVNNPRLAVRRAGARPGGITSTDSQEFELAFETGTVTRVDR